jgi:hypothetical protein
MRIKLDAWFGSKAALTALKSNFRFSPESGLRSDIAGGPFRATNGLMLCSKALHSMISSATSNID